ncbi:uncharacterized protein [Argopecten irradians]|uniref:uncharacterized protein n=1 Tax=Argopecten irradians TaxID=31199 RepID=UPI003719513F
MATSTERKACEKFLKLNEGRDTGTLAHLKILIQRVNVNGQVKARFKVHEDFVKLAGKAYFLDIVMEKFDMRNVNDEPNHPLIPAYIKQVHKEKKTNVASGVMDYLMKSLFIHIVATVWNAGNNKATDLQKENEVKNLKELIKGLGANKTEHSIISISKAAPVIMDVVSNFDDMLNMKKTNTSHKKRSDEDDLNAILKILRKSGIWNYKEGRSLHGFKGINRSPFIFDKPLFHRTLNNIINRLQRDLPIIEENEEEDYGEDVDDHH